MSVARDDGSQDAQALGLGREFLDALKNANAVYFLGGDQWPYVQLFTTNPGALVAQPTTAANMIGGGNNAGTLAVGGVSAGMAILGGYVNTAEFNRGKDVDLTSAMLLQNIYSDQFYGTGHFGITTSIFGINALQGTLLETHFTDSNLDKSPYNRLGRFVDFLGVIMSDYGGFGNPSVTGLAVDDNTGLWFTGDTATVYGEKNVYFAYAGQDASSAFVNGEPGESGQLDVDDIVVDWYGPGDPRAFSLVPNASAGDGQFTVSVYGGKVHIESGTPPSVLT